MYFVGWQRKEKGRWGETRGEIELRGRILKIEMRDSRREGRARQYTL
jgi:hypothetical protein